MGASTQEAVEEQWKDLWVKAPKGPVTKMLFKKEKATPAMLTFLREARVGEINIFGGAGWGKTGGSEPSGRGEQGRGAGPPREMYPFV